MTQTLNQRGFTIGKSCFPRWPSVHGYGSLRASESRWPIATPQASASCPLDSSTPDAGDSLAGQANAARDQCRAKCLLHLGCKGGSYSLTIPALS